MSHARSTIALYTGLDVEYDQQSAIVVSCLPSPLSAVNHRPTALAVAIYIALADGQHAWPKFLSPEFWTKFLKANFMPGISRGKPARSIHRFLYNTGV